MGVEGEEREMRKKEKQKQTQNHTEPRHITSHTILTYVPFQICICICACVYVRKTLMGARGDTDVQIVRDASRRGRQTNRTISQLGPSAVFLKITGAQQLNQEKRMIGGIGHVLFSTFSQT